MKSDRFLSRRSALAMNDDDSSRVERNKSRSTLTSSLSFKHRHGNEHVVKQKTDHMYDDVDVADVVDENEEAHSGSSMSAAVLCGSKRFAASSGRRTRSTSDDERRSAGAVGKEWPLAVSTPSNQSGHDSKSAAKVNKNEGRIYKQWCGSAVEYVDTTGTGDDLHVMFA